MSLPSIQIHFAPEDVTTAQDPVSPFDLNSPTESTLSFHIQQDSFRPTHLLPPPSTSPRPTMIHRTTPQADKQGIDDAKFQQLLRSSRERASAVFSNKREPVELRKQVTIKAHKSKAFERRALFLSKVEQLPTIAAAKTPVTPPESPAIFHFSLPSPGLQSPLALFETLDKHTHVSQRKRETWVEQVDFRHHVQEPQSSDFELDGDAGMIIENVANAALHDDLFIVHPEPTRTRPAAPPMALNAKQNFTRQPNINIIRSPRRAVTIPSLDQITAHLMPTLVADNDTESDISSDDSHSGSNSPVRSPSPPTVNSRSSSPSRAPRAPIPLPAFLNVRRRATDPAQLLVPKITIPTLCVTPPPSDTSFSPVDTSPISIPTLAKRRLSSPASPVLLTPEVSVSPPSDDARTQKGRAMVERLRRRSSPPAPRKDVVAHPVLNCKGGF